MKVLAVFLCLCVVGSMALPSINIFSKEWKDFKALNQKIYKSAAEEILRLKIYLQNKLTILAHNAKYKLGLADFSVEMNNFGDLLEHEFKSVSTGLNLTAAHQTRAISTYERSNRRIPANYDARRDRLVNTPLQQGTCGSCWTFSTTGALEGQLAKKTGRLIPLSQQNLLDCSTTGGNTGCNGGLMNTAFNYIQRAGGLQAASTYPYTGRQGSCRFNPSLAVVKVTGFTTIVPGNDQDLRDALYNVGPVSIAIDASSPLLTFFKGGIFSVPPAACSASKLSHGVVAVGYGTERGRNYWLVKNSWGPQWGEGGFFKILNNGRNLCGVTSMASFPTI